MDSQIILSFINAINSHQPDMIGDLITAEHTFTDALNNSVKGKEQVVKAWRNYLDMFPDFTIQVSEIIQAETCYAVFGFAQATYRNQTNEENSNFFHLPASWRVVVENNKIQQWQVYCDTRIPSEIIQRNDPDAK